ncbi:MAG TPA: hypothetical protein VF411_04965 [Bacteroidia bacterium]
MRNTACIICLKEFEPREGKFYCSNACKQKGYADKKNLSFENQKKEDETKSRQKQIEIYFPEYQKLKNKYPDTMDSFILYCFLRKNLIGVTDVAQVNNYLKTFDRHW